MAWLIESLAQFTPVSSLDELLKQFVVLEQEALPALSLSVRFTCLDPPLSPEAFKALHEFLASSERSRAFKITFLPEQSAFQAQCEALHSTQLQRLNEKTLLPMALDLMPAQDPPIRRAKQQLILGEMQHAMSFSMQHQQQQQQQQSMATQAKRPKPKALILTPETVKVPIETDLSELIDDTNIDTVFDVFWKTLPYSKDLTLKQVWEQLVETAHLPKARLNAPVVQKIQKQALEQILLHFSLFSSGVVAHNLPDGFFWTRAPETEAWVLGYDDKKGVLWRSEAPNPLTRQITDLPLTPDLLPASAITQLAKSKSPLSSEKALQDHYESLYNHKASHSDKQKALIFLIEALKGILPEPLIKACCQKITDFKALTEVDFEGCGQVIATHGVTGLFVLLTYLERLQLHQKLTLFRELYLQNPAHYAALLQPEPLAALITLCQFREDAHRFWWPLLEAQVKSPMRQATTLSSDLKACLYFIQEVSALTSSSGHQLPPDAFATMTPILPIKMTLDRLLLMLRNAAFPKEQLAHLHHLNISAWGGVFASQQQQYRLISEKMHLVSLEVGASAYITPSLVQSTGDPLFERYAARTIGQEAFRAGDWEAYQWMRQEVSAWVISHNQATLTDLEKTTQKPRSINLMMTLLIYLTLGETPFIEIQDLKYDVTQMLKKFTTLTKTMKCANASWINCLEEPLKYLETYTRGALTLPEWNKGLTLILALKDCATFYVASDARDASSYPIRTALALLATYGAESAGLFRFISTLSTPPPFNWHRFGQVLTCVLQADQAVFESQPLKALSGEAFSLQDQLRYLQCGALACANAPIPPEENDALTAHCQVILKSYTTGEHRVFKHTPSKWEDTSISYPSQKTGDVFTQHIYPLFLYMQRLFLTPAQRYAFTRVILSLDSERSTQLLSNSFFVTLIPFFIEKGCTLSQENYQKWIEEASNPEQLTPPPCVFNVARVESEDTVARQTARPQDLKRDIANVMKDATDITELILTLKQMRDTLPEGLIVALAIMKRTLEEKKNNLENPSPTEETSFTDSLLLKLINSVIEHYEAYHQTLTHLSNTFCKTPYQSQPLQDDLNILGSLLQKTLSPFTGPAWIAGGAAKLALRATLTLFGKKLLQQKKDAFKSEGEHAVAQQESEALFSQVKSEITPFAWSYYKWVIQLLKEDCLSWINPIIEALFNLLKFVEQHPGTLDEAFLEKCLPYFQALEESVFGFLTHKIGKHALVDYIKKIADALTDTDTLYGIPIKPLLLFVLQVIEHKEVVKTFTPMIRLFFKMSVASRSEDPSLFYQLMRDCEKEFIQRYHALDKTYALKKFFKTLLDNSNLRAQKVIEATKELTPKPTPGIAENRPFVEEQPYLYRAYEWLAQPTDSVTPLFYSYFDVINHRIERLAVTLHITPPALAQQFSAQLVKHALSDIDVTQPIDQVIQAFEPRVNTLRLLILQLNALQTQGLPFESLIRLILQGYEQGLSVPVLEALLKTLSRCPEETPFYFFEKCIAMIVSDVCPVKTMGPIFYRALERLYNAFVAENRPLEADKRHDFYLQQFLEGLLENQYLSPEKIAQWQKIPGINQGALNALLTTLSQGLLTKTVEEKTVHALIHTMDTVIQVTPSLIESLRIILITPSLRQYYHHTAASPEKNNFLFPIIAALHEQSLTPEEWAKVTTFLEDHKANWDHIKHCFNPFLYSPFPHKERFLALLTFTDQAQQEALLEKIDSDPVWAATSPSDEDKLAQKRRPQVPYTEEHLIAMLESIKTPQDEKPLPLALRHALAEESAWLSAQIAGTMQESRETLTAHLKRIVALIKRNPDANIQAEDSFKTRLEWLAVVSAILFRTTGIVPNDIQLVAILLNWHTQGHILLQLNTGEGKSYVTALLAAWEWLRIGTVDVISANIDLVRQDYLTKGIAHFFQFLHIPSRLLVAGEQAQYQPGYIYYTTPWDRSFIASESLLATYHRKPSYPVVSIVDECDWLLLKMVGITFNYVRSLNNDNPHAWIYPLVMTFIKSKDFLNIARGPIKRWSSPKDVIELKHHLDTHATAHESDWQTLCREPEKKLFRRLGRWIDAACYASLLRSGKHFICLKDKQREGYYVAVPILNDVPQLGAQYNNGVQCFLQVLLQQQYPDKLFAIPEELRTIDTDYPLGLISMYERMIGLSATLGVMQEQAYLKDKLATEAFVLPPYRPSQCLPSILKLYKNQAAHFKRILKEINKVSSDEPPGSMPVLIIEEDSNYVKALYDFLIKNKKDPWRLQCVLGTETESEKKKILLQAEQPNTITLCTTLFSRGLDLRPAHPEGLYVMMACLKDKETVLQSLGRAGRFGQKGKSRLILDAQRYGLEEAATKSTAQKQQVIETLQQIISENKSVERYYTQEAALIRAGALSFFDEACAFLVSLSTPEYQHDLKYKLLTFREDWIEEMEDLWDQALLKTDPENTLTHLYVRRHPDGSLDTTSLEDLLMQYPQLIQAEWVVLRAQILEQTKPFLHATPIDIGRVDNYSPYPTSRGLTAGSRNLSTSLDPAVKPRDVGEEIKYQQSPQVPFQFKYFFEVQDMEHCISDYQCQQQRRPPPAQTHPATPLKSWPPQVLDLEAKSRFASSSEKAVTLQKLTDKRLEILEKETPTESIKPTKETEADRLLVLCSTWNDNFKNITLHTFKFHYDKGVNLLGVTQQHLANASPNPELSKAVDALKQSLDNSGKDISLKIAKSLSWAKKGTRTWRFWLCRPLVRTAAKAILAAIEALNQHTPINLDKLTALQQTLTKHQTILKNKFLFPWNKSFRRLITRARDLLETCATTLPPPTNKDTAPPVVTKKPTPAPQSESTQKFFKEWESATQQEKTDLQQVIETLTTMPETLPPWTIDRKYLPVPLVANIDKLNTLTDTLTNWAQVTDEKIIQQVQALNNASLTELTNIYHRTQTLTWETLENKEPFCAIYAEKQDLQNRIKRCEESIAQLKNPPPKSSSTFFSFFQYKKSNPDYLHQHIQVIEKQKETYQSSLTTLLNEKFIPYQAKQVDDLKASLKTKMTSLQTEILDTCRNEAAKALPQLHLKFERLSSVDKKYRL